MKITENTTLAEILDSNPPTTQPELVKILVKYNLPCVNCPLAKYEMENLKIGEICKMYNINVQKLLGELSKLYKK
jgi:hypothetical protein